MAETLTAEQAAQMATWYRELALAISDYRSENRDHLSPEDLERLRVKRDDVRTCSTQFIQLALHLTLDELSATLVRIKGATDQMKAAITHLQTVDKVIKIATAAVLLGGAIVGGNPVAIAQAIGGAISAASPEPPKPPEPEA